MKFSALIYAALALAATATFSVAQAANEPEKIAATYDRVYVPTGFDSNDQVQIVGVAKFENACYRPAETKVRVDREAKRIYLGAAAYKYNGFCAQVVLNVERVIDLGVLPEGKYEIFQEGQDKALGTIDVKGAVKAEPDDFLYAPVSQAMVDDKDGGTTELLIKGEFATDCMRIKEVKTDAENGVIIVQPIAEIDQRRDCAVGYFPFRKIVKVQVPKGRYLLHVRSMNANAVNSVVQVN